MNTTIRMKSIAYEPSNAHAEGLRFEQVVTIRRILATSAMLLMFALTALGLSTAQGGVPGAWYSNLDSAVKHSERLQRPLFVMIARTGCHACELMERNLAAPTTRRALDGAVKVRLESSNYPRLTSQYARGGTPTTLIFSPGRYNAPIYTYTGVMDPNTIVQVGRSIDSM